MREINLLHPDLQIKCKKLIELVKTKGLTIIITQTIRSKEEQDALYAQGRTAPGRIVTNCKYPNSPHNWGVAFDFVVVDSAGKAVWSDAADTDKDGKIDWYEVAELGKSLGLEWGGDWQRFKDKPHFEMPEFFPNNSPTMLLAKYTTPGNFIKTWEVVNMPGFEGPAKVTYKGKEIPAGILDDETYAKVKPLAALFGKKVVWVPETKTVDIQDK